MTEEDLDNVYTKLCHALTEVGEAQTPAVLARLTLLPMKRVGSVAAIHEAIDTALEAG